MADGVPADLLGLDTFGPYGAALFNELVGELIIEKPPASLARAAHVNRDDHHHLVKEAEKRRNGMGELS